MDAIAALILAVILAVAATIAAKAKMAKTAKFFGVVAILVFIGWLASGPGFAMLNWFEDPSVDIPSVDINQ